MAIATISGGFSVFQKRVIANGDSCAIVKEDKQKNIGGQKYEDYLYR